MNASGKIRVKKDIMQYYGEFQFRFPYDLQCPSLLLAVEKGVVNLAELLWAGEMVQGLARSGHLFSQGLEESLMSKEWVNGIPYSAYPAPVIGKRLDLVSEVFLCMKNLADGKFYKLRLSALLYLLPNYFPMYDRPAPTKHGDDGMQAIADVFVRKGPGTSGVSTEMNLDEIGDFLADGGVPFDVE